MVVIFQTSNLEIELVNFFLSFLINLNFNVIIHMSVYVYSLSWVIILILGGLLVTRINFKAISRNYLLQYIFMGSYTIRVLYARIV